AVGDPVRLTITYTNVSKGTVVLLANGLPSGEGFPGETFEVTHGRTTKAYPVHAIDPAVKQVTLKPGAKWERTINDLGKELLQNEARLSSDDCLAAPGEYKVRVRYAPTVQGQKPPTFSGTAASNAVAFTVVNLSEKTQKAVAALKANPERLGLSVQFHGK